MSVATTHGFTQLRRIEHGVRESIQQSGSRRSEHSTLFFWDVFWQAFWLLRDTPHRAWARRNGLQEDPGVVGCDLTRT